LTLSSQAWMYVRCVENAPAGISQVPLELLYDILPLLKFVAVFEHGHLDPLSHLLQNRLKLPRVLVLVPDMIAQNLLVGQFLGGKLREHQLWGLQFPLATKRDAPAPQHLLVLLCVIVSALLVDKRHKDIPEVQWPQLGRLADRWQGDGEHANNAKSIMIYKCNIVLYNEGWDV
jgi:hypothetical protein